MQSTGARELTSVQIGLACAALSLLVFGGYAFHFGTLAGFVNAVDHCASIFCDFELHFYPVGEAVFAERRAVTYFVYPPFAAFLFGFFGLFDYPTARVLWGVAQLAAGAALFALARPDPRRDGAWLCAAYLLVFLTCVPLLHNTKWGQVSVFVTAAMLGCLELQRRHRPVAAALLLAAATAVKAYPAIFVVHAVLRRDWRFLGVFAAALLVFLAGMPVLVLGWHETWAFYDQISGWIAQLTPDFLGRWNTQYLPAAASRVWWGKFEPGSTAGVALAAAGYGLALCNAAGLLWLYRRAVEPLPERIAVVSLLVLPLLLPVTWPHYLVFLPFCQLWLTRLALRADGFRRVGSLATVAVSVGLASVFALGLAGHWIVYARAGWLAWSDLVLLTGFWIEAAPLAFSRADGKVRA